MGGAGDIAGTLKPDICVPIFRLTRRRELYRVQMTRSSAFEPNKFMPALLPGFENRVVVGMADFAVSNSPNLILTTYALGSCLGIAVFDPVARAGGLLHTMLPDSNLQPEKALAQPGMFVDTGMRALFAAIAELGAEPQRMKIYVAGGAQIMDPSGVFNI